MTDYIPYVIGALILILFLFVFFSNFLVELPPENKIKIKTADYMKSLDPVIWESEEEWEAFYCDLCRYGNAYHINLGNVTCPNYPSESCGCGVSIKLKFETNINNPDLVNNCSISVNGEITKKFSNITLGKKEHNILLGLSEGGKIDNKNVLKVCCGRFCDLKSLPEICY